MPTYQYACTECGHAFEAVQSFSDEALRTCPECTGRLRKVFNAVGVVFKGSGFYRTDSRKQAESAGKGQPAKSTKGEASSSPATQPAGSAAGGSSTSSSSEGSAA